MTWRAAYLKQAEDDYVVFRRLNQGRQPVHQQLHYLQMATEKLAKAYTCGADNKPPKTTHTALTRFMRISKGRQELRRQLRYGSNYHAFAAYVDSLLPLAEKIERLAPESSMKRPNPEYPWEDAQGVIISPVDFGFDDIWRRQTEIDKLKRFIMDLILIAKN
jgi:hypothetical protein